MFGSRRRSTVEPTASPSNSEADTAFSIDSRPGVEPVEEGLVLAVTLDAAGVASAVGASPSAPHAALARASAAISTIRKFTR